MDDKTKTSSPHTNHHWHQPQHPTHNSTLPNMQHIWMHKPWGTCLLLPWVSILPTKNNMDDSHPLWIFLGVAWTNCLCCQLPYQNHHSNSQRVSQSMLARIVLYQRNHKWSTWCSPNINTLLWPDHNTLLTNTYQLNMDKLHKKPSLTFSPPYPTGHQIHPGHCEHTSLLCPFCQPNTSCCPQCHCLLTSQEHKSS